MNKEIQKINFEIGKDPLEFHTFEINLMEPFGERSPKGERKHIPCWLIEFDGETWTLAALEPSLTMSSMGFFHLGERKKRGGAIWVWEIIRVRLV